MNKKRKSMSFTYDEIEFILKCFHTSKIYLENCNCRFNLLDLNFYNGTICKGIKKIELYEKKFSKVLSKFSNESIISEDNIITTYKKLLN